MNSIRRSIGFWFLLLVIANAQPAVDPIVVARRALNLLLAGNYAELRAMFDQQMLAALTEETLRRQVGPQIARLGKPQSFGSPTTERVQDVTAVVFPGRFPAGNFNLVISIDHAGKVAGLFLQPAQPNEPSPGAGPAPTPWVRPEYSVPASFRERAVNVVTGNFSLPGTLTFPVTPGPHPAIVLIQGSGPSDRDESAFAYKPFRDLAEGLASRGIVVLRYDKRTFTYRPPPSLEGFTPEAETVDDALSALALIRRQPEVDRNQVFLLGHSFGGYLAPRVATKDGRLAGLVILAADLRPLENVIPEQSQQAGANNQELADLQRQVASIKVLHAGETGFYLGLPASYWLDLKWYDPVAQTRVLRCRVLLIEGGRDFEVPAEDENRWKSALASDRNATVLIYPNLNHFLVPGTRPSSPAEYSTPGHVALAVINDIANWIKS
jgi:pimeloyl-ACP methyl ester carboxylesterase